MVLTQLQLKWPNHSTHLLTRLTYLFKNEQLVDCTLTCNKHSLKVHRSVLAACSPYFERELQNNPSIVVKDMQFSVLQALIEFMYYGETRITEENLTSLIEAAKLFEVKGLSEMDLMSGKNGVISSISAVDSDCMVESSCPSDDADTSFRATSSPAEQRSLAPSNELTTLTTLTTYDGGTDGDVMSESADTCEPHSSRNFVVTPPQTESAQILLSLARSHSQSQPQHPASTCELADSTNAMANTDGFLSPDAKQEVHSITNNMLFNEHNLILNQLPVVSNNANDMVIEEELSDKCAPTEGAADSGKSLLAKLLTRNNQASAKARYEGDSYKTLYETTATSTSCKTVEEPLQSSIILECPFLIETNDGNYVDVSVENMLSAFENGDIFEANGKNVKMVSKEEPVVVDNTLEDPVLEHITQHEELADDPEAVVLCKVGADGRLEKYVLSSADVKALKEMNERIAKEKQRGCTATETHIAEIETPVSNSDTRLITRILDYGSKVENAISRLPFKRAGYLNVPGNAGESSSSLGASERILDASLTVDAHHHENMFEELDNQFNMDCSSIDIQRDYVAYEEASKNETQLEHNYYANAMKDEDEECVVISDNYDLRMLMLTEEAEVAALTAKTPKRRVTGAQDVCLNGYAATAASRNATRVNGLGTVDKTAAVLNGAKCDLIVNTDALMTSVVETPPAKNQKRVNGLTKNCRPAKSENTTLPFKSVKSANTFRTSQLDKKPAKRTYKRKSSGSNQDHERKRNGNLNGGFCNENSLVEEIIVDEVS